MHNIMAIVRRDCRRLLRVPTAWVVIIGITVVPALYAWFNIIGFWDPYGNTANVQVAVVNEDRTVDSALGTINMGDRIVDELKTNHELGWQFTSKATAMHDVRSGSSYAAVVIPSDFSAHISTILTSNTSKPSLDYYVNEKASAIASKITQTGVNQVDQQVNGTFVSIASKVIASTLNDAGTQVNDESSTIAANTVAKLNTAQGNITSTRQTIADLNRQIDTLKQNEAQARDALNRARALSTNAQKGLLTASNTIDTSRTSLNRFIGTATGNLDEASGMIAQYSSASNLAVSNVSAALTEANANVTTVITAAQDVHDTNASIIAELKKLSDSSAGQGLDTSSVIEALTKQNKQLQSNIDDLNALNTDTGTTITNVAKASDSLNTATQQTLSNSAAARNTISSGALPQFNTGLATLAGTTADLSSQAASSGVLYNQASQVIDQLDTTASSTTKALAATDSGLASVQSRLDALTTELNTIATSGALTALTGNNAKLDVSSIADFMLSPTVLTTKVLYPVATYGSGMAPLFTNLALWVGAFMLMAMIKLEVDDDDLQIRPTMAQRYWGRWILLATLAACQGMVTTIGELIIGVQTVSPWLFVLTGVLTSLVYVSITYALSTSFMHVGKGLCIAMVILQIPGASGLYPIEMMPGFFRMLYPFFPFSYSINALRETIGGFYDYHWGINMMKLGGFAVAFFILGLAVRPRLSGLNRVFAQEIAESDMIVGEKIQRSQDNPYPASELLSVYADKQAYRVSVVRHFTMFERAYPKIKQALLIAGIIVPLIFIFTFSFTTGTKVVALAAWVIWVLATIAVLMTIEMLRGRLERHMQLSEKSDDEIRQLLHDYGSQRIHMPRHALEHVE